MFKRFGCRIRQVPSGTVGACIRWHEFAFLSKKDFSIHFIALLSCILPVRNAHPALPDVHLFHMMAYSAAFSAWLLLLEYISGSSHTVIHICMVIKRIIS